MRSILRGWTEHALAKRNLKNVFRQASFRETELFESLRAV